ncbi:MAG: DoxX family protein [Armatimonadetes bacterium]|nr:MAG: DoxX family protein [Armatimonadota bacterium]
MESKTLTGIALLILRLVLGVIMAAHGLQKVGFLGGQPLSQTVEFMQGQFNLPVWSVYCAVAAELLGGVALIIGILGRFAAMGVAATMVVAIWVAHWPHFFAKDGGMEFPLALLGMALALILTGMGPYSLDAKIARKMDAVAGRGEAA